MKKKSRRLLALLLVHTLILSARIIPRRWGLTLFAFLGSLGFRLYRTDRERAIRNIARSFPGADALIVRAIAKGSFEALGRNALDALRLIHLPKERVLGLCTIEGEEHLRSAIAEGNGVIGLTGHIGCWELMAAHLTAKGYKISVIARSLYDRRMDDLLVSMRRRHGIVSIPRGSSAVAGYRVLRRGEILGMLLDQDIDVDGVFVPFFGRPAHTALGAAAFALRSGAAIVPMAIHLQPGRRHHITILPRLEAPGGGMPKEVRIAELTRSCSEAIERLIRIYPQQWVWFHDRWRKRPDRRSGESLERAEAFEGTGIQ